jgi:2-methylcitrate dehydratase PrpD
MCPQLDRFIQIIRENDLDPEDIERVEFTSVVSNLNRLWEENKLSTDEDLGFHTPYHIACVAHGLKYIDMADPETKNDPRIRDFMPKVTILPPDEDYGKAMLKYPGHDVRLVTVTVWAKGKTFTSQNRFLEWHWNSDVKATDDELVGKFNEVVSDFLPSTKREKAVKALLGLEEVGQLNDIMELFWA